MAILFIALFSILMLHDQPAPVTVCELQAHPEQYAGKSVMRTADYLGGEKIAILYDGHCRAPDKPPLISPDLPEKLPHGRSSKNWSSYYNTAIGPRSPWWARLS